MNQQRMTGWALASDPRRLTQLFGTGDLLPLWIAEPYLPLSAEIVAAMEERAQVGWYGYETRPPAVIDAFWGWMARRHHWVGTELHTSVSPSVGTSIGVLIEMLTEPGDGVILQPPVFTDFKPLVVSADRQVVRNPLVLDDGRYRMDMDDLAARASDPNTRMMILCNPHNPVGRLWTSDELRAVAEVCAANDVFVVADEIHADLVLGSGRFVPFAAAAAAEGTGVSWAATHGPIKTFGLAGVCDTLLITDDRGLADRFRRHTSRFHLTRNNVFGTVAFETAYRSAGPWVDGLLDLVASNFELLEQTLPDDIGLIRPEATYLAWLDLRGLGLDVPDLVRWITNAGLALSPGHWFGRQGAGFARMTVAVPTEVIEEAVRRLTVASR